MSFPEPYPGLVIRYSYLWKREQDEGREEGSKDRPCAVLLSVLDEDEEREVLVLPITHITRKPGRRDRNSIGHEESPGARRREIMDRDHGSERIRVARARPEAPAGSRYVDDCLWVPAAEVFRTRSRRVPRARSTRQVSAREKVRVNCKRPIPLR